MLKNYLKIAWRNVSRHKMYAAINVIGLALGICGCIVIYLIVSYELSFDKFHPDKDRIYRIVGEIQRSSGEKEFLNSPFSDVAGFETDIPGFEAKTGIHFYGSSKISIPDGDGAAEKFDSRIEGSYQTATVIVRPQYFSIFRYEWLEGDATTLNDPNRVVLTESRARKYFGNIPLSRMIGRTVLYDDSLQTTVSGIIKDWNKNTDFGYTDFISLSTATHSFLKNQVPTDDWSSLSPHRSMAFVKLEKGVSAAQINQRFETYIKEHVKQGPNGSKLTMYLQPLTGIHFTPDFHKSDDGDDFRKAYLPTLYVLMGLALFILIIAAVNFVNLSTAQSVQRAKEIGVRKVLGSGKTSIVFQFLTETLVLTLLAVFLSLCLVNPVLSAFSSFIPQGVEFHWYTPSTLIFLSLIICFTSLLAGFYPAILLSSYVPAQTLKGAAFKKSGGNRLRKGLIVFQFTLSIVFIIGAIVIGNQISFMNKADKGFSSDAIITINNGPGTADKMKIFSESIKHIPGINSVILQGNSPMGFAHGGQNFIYKGKNEIPLQVSFDAADEKFIPFYQMKLIAGRNIFHSDSLYELVINETCSKAMGFTKPGEAVGKLLYNGNQSYPVVGVVADFHESSFHEAVKPVVIGTTPRRQWSLAFKLDAGVKESVAVKGILSATENEWEKVFSDRKMNYSFLNESITRLFDQDNKIAWLVNVTMIITIFISCMGLFGLGMFTAQKRTKEISIRKVLGAGMINIMTMLSKDFVILVLIALLIASPVAYYFMHQWLLDFAYRIAISWWVFVLAGAAAILIALVTVSIHAIKAAIANPVKSLRTE